MDEGRKSVLAIVAGILVARHLKTPEDLDNRRPSPRTENLVSSAVQWADRTMRRSMACSAIRLVTESDDPERGRDADFRGGKCSFKTPQSRSKAEHTRSDGQVDPNCARSISGPKSRCCEGWSNIRGRVLAGHNSLGKGRESCSS
jgi:hypothetical protein